jgi:hypothetical protein
VRTLALGLLLLLASAAHAQGCDQCREAIGQTPPRTQQAYRRAITVLVLAGTTIFAGTILALKRFR